MPNVTQQVVHRRLHSHPCLTRFCSCKVLLVFLAKSRATNMTTVRTSIYPWLRFHGVPKCHQRLSALQNSNLTQMTWSFFLLAQACFSRRRNPSDHGQSMWIESKQFTISPWPVLAWHIHVRREAFVGLPCGTCNKIGRAWHLWASLKETHLPNRIFHGQCWFYEGNHHEIVQALEFFFGRGTTQEAVFFLCTAKVVRQPWWHKRCALIRMSRPLIVCVQKCPTTSGKQKTIYRIIYFYLTSKPPHWPHLLKPATKEHKISFTPWNTALLKPMCLVTTAHKAPRKKWVTELDSCFIQANYSQMEPPIMTLRASP